MNKRDIESIGGRIAYDETFVAIKGVPGLFISNYGRLASKRQTETKLCKTSFYNGYENYHTYTKRYGKYKGVVLKPHRLVAEYFIPIPEWIRAEDLKNLVVHHILKVSRYTNIYGLNVATNLVWLPQAVHIALHGNEQVQLLIDGKYKTFNFLDGCKRMRITPYDMVDVLKTQPTIEGNYKYFSHTVSRDDGKSIVIDLRVVDK